MSTDEGIKQALEGVTLPEHIHDFSCNWHLRFYSKIIEYVNRTGYKKDLFAINIGSSAEEIMSLFTNDLVNFYAGCLNMHIDSSLRKACLKLINMYYVHLSELVLESEISKSQLEFMIRRTNLFYKSNKIEKMLSEYKEIRIIVKYKKAVNNNPKQIPIILKHMNIPNEIFDNIEEYHDVHCNESKYNLFLRMKQCEAAYEKLATFVETLDNYSQDTKDDNDIIITRTALNSALEVVHSSP